MTLISKIADMQALVSRAAQQERDLLEVAERTGDPASYMAYRIAKVDTIGVRAELNGLYAIQAAVQERQNEGNTE